MEQTEQYVNMMLDSLKKKDELLELIIGINKEQTDIASESEFDMDKFAASVETKQKYIDELNRLDSGFQALYDNIKEPLINEKTRYTVEIRMMQEYIKLLSEKSILIQVQEEKNRLSIQAHVAKMKKEVKVAKQSMKAASDYYKSMSKTAYVDSQFMDKKK